MANIRGIVFSIEDKYLDMDHFIDSTPYINNRLHHYLGGVLVDDSTNILKTYSPFMAEVVLKGRKPS
jgi:tRNA(adenine34) deaminase